MSSSTVVDVYSAANEQEAYIVSAMLAEAGIEARVVGDILAWAGGCLPLGQSISPQVWVASEDAPRARQLIDESKASRSNPVPTLTEPWNCANCGESIEGTLEICWKCGTSRSGQKSADFPIEQDTQPIDDEAPRQKSFNARVLCLSLLLGAMALAASGFVGASLLLLVVYGALSGLFSAITGWLVTLHLPSRDEQNNGR